MQLKTVHIALFLISILFTVSGCQDKPAQKEFPTKEEVREPLIEINKRYVQEEHLQIDAYIDRRGWDMTKTGTGLRYMIYEAGNKQDTAREGLYAKVKYDISLIDGTVCYSSEKEGAQEFRIGQDNVESGLHEGITYMCKGDKARFVIPSYLAHGLIGDLNKIPARSTVIYDIELIDLRQ